MKRKELINTVSSITNSFLVKLRKNNDLSFAKKPIYSLFEIYYTSDIVGTLAFDFYFKNSITLITAKKDLNIKAMSLLGESELKYIHLVAFETNPKDETQIQKLRVFINLEEIEEYLKEMCLHTFQKLGFKSTEKFLERFKGYGFEDILAWGKDTTQSYILSKNSVSLRLISENPTIVEKLKNFRLYLDANKKCFKLLDKNKRIYFTKVDNQSVIIRFLNSNNEKGVSFENDVPNSLAISKEEQQAVSEPTHQSISEAAKTSEFIK